MSNDGSYGDALKVHKEEKKPRSAGLNPLTFLLKNKKPGFIVLFVVLASVLTFFYLSDVGDIGYIVTPPSENGEPTPQSTGTTKASYKPVTDINDAFISGFLEDTKDIYEKYPFDEENFIGVEGVYFSKNKETGIYEFGVKVWGKATNEQNGAFDVEHPLGRITIKYDTSSVPSELFTNDRHTGALLNLKLLSTRDAIKKLTGSHEHIIVKALVTENGSLVADEINIIPTSLDGTPQVDLDL